jgi:hypothetical protein
LGDKKYGKDGMDALRDAGREHASEKTMQNIRAKYSSKEQPITEVGEGEEKNLLDPYKHLNPRVSNPEIKGTKNKAKSAYYPEPKPPVKKLDTPYTKESVEESSNDLVRILNIAGIRK